jgi:N-acylneuraminate cytidylyltransferase
MTPLLPLNPAEQPWHSSQYQSLPEVYVQNASLEIAWTRVVFDGRTIAGQVLVPFFTEGYEGFDINHPQDWAMAAELIKKGQADLTPVTKAPYSR